MRQPAGELTDRRRLLRFEELGLERVALRHVQTRHRALLPILRAGMSV